MKTNVHRSKAPLQHFDMVIHVEHVCICDSGPSSWQERWTNRQQRRRSQWPIELGKTPKVIRPTLRRHGQSHKLQNHGYCQPESQGCLADLGSPKQTQVSIYIRTKQAKYTCWRACRLQHPLTTVRRMQTSLVASWAIGQWAHAQGGSIWELQITPAMKGSR